MCQIKSEPVHQAEEDIICYKVLNKKLLPSMVVGVEDKIAYFGPYQGVQYEVGSTYVIDDDEEEKIADEGTELLCIRGGFYHMVADEEDARKFKDYLTRTWWFDEFVVSKCRIPKGTRISYGWYKDSTFGPPVRKFDCKSLCARTFELLEIMK